MKNIIVIAVIGKNQVYSPGGYLTFQHREQCDVHFGIRNELRHSHSIITYSTAFETIPDSALPVYSDHSVYIIDDETDETETFSVENMTVISSLDQALSLIKHDDQKIYVFPNKPLYDKLIERYAERISSIEVITCDKAFRGKDRFTDPLSTQWSPVITREENNPSTKIVDYVLHSWKNRYLDI